MPSKWLFAAALAAFPAAPAAAQTVSADDVVAALSDRNLSPALERDNSGAPLIRAKYGNLNFLVFFNCEGSCSSISFLTRVDMERVYPLDRANAWNAANRFGRVYIQDDDPVMVMDVSLQGGMSPGLLRDNVEWWEAAVDSFRKHLAE